MEYLICKTKKNIPLNLIENSGAFSLTTEVLVNSAFTTPSLSKAIEVALGLGDGSKDSPLFNAPELGYVDLMFEVNSKALPLKKNLDIIDQPEDGDFKLSNLDLDADWAGLAPEQLVFMYAKNIRKEIKGVMGEGYRVLRLLKSFCDSYKLGDTVVAYSPYSQTLFTGNAYKILDEVNLELLDENRGTDSDKYSYWIVRKLSQ